ncbi:MAG: hypothetical protein C4529_03860 [Deltaproteobacteria bacterium]|nr:MAG: hypothetical protein C4529_03860 [Deltaproteobacteria bacterium]
MSGSVFVLKQDKGPSKIIFHAVSRRSVQVFRRIRNPSQDEDTLTVDIVVVVDCCRLTSVAGKHESTVPREGLEQEIEDTVLAAQVHRRDSAPIRHDPAQLIKA